MRAVVMTDIHLEFINQKKRKEFYRSIQESNSDLVLIGGDITTADKLEAWLIKLQSVAAVPVYFCLGNHDFYGSSIFQIREVARKITRENPKISWLPAVSKVELSHDLLLIGHDCWGDARAGSIYTSDLELADFNYIEDLKGLSKYSRREVLMRLGSEAADYFSSVLQGGTGKYKKVVILTHVPPFPQACLFMGKPSVDGLPYFCCKAVGDVLHDEALKNPSTEFVVLSGHTHDAAKVKILPNLRSTVLGADYGRPNFTLIDF